MTNLNVTNLNNASAATIANVLDAKDGNTDGKIKASIWNEFVADKGGKTIQYEINLDNAVRSITTYLARTGQNVNDLASEWLTKAQESNANIKLSNKTLKSGNLTITVDPSGKEIYEFIKDQKGSNGYTYMEASKIVDDIELKARRGWGNHTYVDSNGKKRSNSLLAEVGLAPNAPYREENMAYVMKECVSMGILTQEEVDMYYKAKADFQEIRRNNPDINYLKLGFYLFLNNM